MAETSDEQIASVNARCRRLRLPLHLLDVHCEQRFGRTFARLNRREVGLLIDEGKGWKEIPASLRVAQGQTVMAGMGLG